MLHGHSIARVRRVVDGIRNTAAPRKSSPTFTESHRIRRQRVTPQTHDEG